MKMLIIVVVAVAVTTAGCSSMKPSSGRTGLKSERQYAEDSEARAQDLYRTGQAATISEARAQAAGEANADWAAAAKAAERKHREDKMDKDLSRMVRDGSRE